MLLLWPDEIGPDPELSPLPPPGLQGPPVGAKLPRGAAARARGKQNAFDPGPNLQIDREAFILSFRRQAQGALLDCLRESRNGPGSLHLAATLLKSGRLKNIRAIEADGEVPSCLNPLVEQMSFAPLTTAMQLDSHELQCRLDW